MSWDTSLQELNQVYFIENSDDIFKELRLLQTKKYNDFLISFNETLQKENTQEEILKNLKAQFNKNIDEFYTHFNYFLTPEHCKSIPLTAKAEINIIEANINNLSNESIYQKHLNHPFIQKKCKPIIIYTYKKLIERISMDFLDVKIQKSNPKGVLTKKFNQNYFTKHDESKKINFTKLNENLKLLNLIDKNTKDITLENLFNKDYASNVKWIGAENKLCYFIQHLNKKDIIIDNFYWSIAKEIFLNKNGEKFINIQKVYGKDIPKSAKKIENCIKGSYKY